MLAKYGSYTYGYNADGIRVEKVVNGTAHKYFTEGGIIHKETRGSDSLWYYYGAEGIDAFEHNGTNYYYYKNLQGDIIAIQNAGGSIVARYVYDAWGNHKVQNPDGSENTSPTFIGNVNPFRYRSYYFDVETKLYYLQSRYYDPEFGRFINPASIESLNFNVIGGLNLYALPGNNPLLFTANRDNIGSSEVSGRFFGSMSKTNDVGTITGENQSTSSASNERFNFGYFAGFIEYSASVALGFMTALAKNNGFRDMAKSLAKSSSGLDKITKALGVAALALDLGIGVISDYNAGKSHATVWANFAVDASVGAASIIITSFLVGCAGGSAVPILGNLAGAVVGLVVGLTITLALSDVIQDAKSQLASQFEDVGNWLKKIFS